MRCDRSSLQRSKKQSSETRLRSRILRFLAGDLGGARASRRTKMPRSSPKRLLVWTKKQGKMRERAMSLLARRKPKRRNISRLLCPIPILRRASTSKRFLPTPSHPKPVPWAAFRGASLHESSRSQGQSSNRSRSFMAYELCATLSLVFVNYIVAVINICIGTNGEQCLPFWEFGKRTVLIKIVNPLLRAWACSFVIKAHISIGKPGGKSSTCHSCAF